ncbi:hypothetical protein MNV49_003012 [Pseudohyphozyma bogoriensis]|nr:hypothetical protein MNV49_003012 [Pseudohyphozyma bogoriensis]
MSTYKPTEHDGLKQDGSPDKRVSSEHGLGGDRERARELGKQGGSKGGKQTSHDGQLDDDEDIVDDSGEYTPAGDYSGADARDKE